MSFTIMNPSIDSSSTKRITIDRTRSLSDQVGTGHNRLHPDITPVLRVEPGDIVVLETRDALDGQITESTSTADLGALDYNVIHPLTGPVYVEGAEPGDLLEVHVLDVQTQPFGYTACSTGFGFLRAFFPESFLAKWKLVNGVAMSEQIPGVRIPGRPFLGVMAVAPSHSLFKMQAAREEILRKAGELIFPPEPSSAVPAEPAVAHHGLRTIPSRENGGNADIKDLTAGTTLFLPVYVPGALFSAGDGHFAQGDGEACGAAIETGATATLRFGLRKGVAERRNITGPQFERRGAGSPIAPRPYFAVTGIPITKDGVNRAEDLNLATQNALLNMIDHLVAERGFTREQSYILASVAVDVRISALVDVPNPVVSARVPLDIFDV